jgi:hypothetical protein
LIVTYVAARVAAQEPAPKAWTIESTAGSFITAITADHDGGLWVAAEDQGVSYRSPAGRWTNYRADSGLGDRHAYAIACDRQGRIWAGLANHGVSVFIGGTWTNYDVPFGPAGERVFAIACHPVDGDVWMATNRGLTRWVAAEDRWQHFTTRNGLPELPISLAFEPRGALLAGLPTQGVARADSAGKYERWQQISGPTPDELPAMPAGEGLPCGLVNGISVSPQGNVFVATCAGLAMRPATSTAWQYVRGEDYLERVRLRARRGREPARLPSSPSLVPADYVTVVACAPDDRLWIGTRESGGGVFVPGQGATDWVREDSAGHPQNFVTSVAFTTDGHVWMGTYGGGLARSNVPMIAARQVRGPQRPSRSLKQQTVNPSPPEPPLAPKPAAPLSVEDTIAARESLDKHIRVIPPSRPAPRAMVSADEIDAPLPPAALPQAVTDMDDWRTQGDFYGEQPLNDYRYGEWMGYLCAHGAPFDLYWGRHMMSIRGRIGSHATADDSLRHWIHWRKTTDRRSLKSPSLGYRRQAEWDDHGEAYSLNHEGPHVYVDLPIPPGVHRLSLYFFNKDGHEKRNRLRDYLVTVKPFAETDAAFARAPALARGRVRDFWSGVYKTFTVVGPAAYTIEIHDNQSHNVIVSGVFCDPVSPQPHIEKEDQWIPRIDWAVPTKKNGPEFADIRGSAEVCESIRLWQSVKAMIARDAWAGRKAVSDCAPIVLRTLLAAKQPLPTAALRVQAECHAELCQYDERDALYRRVALEEKNP